MQEQEFDEWKTSAATKQDPNYEVGVLFCKGAIQWDKLNHLPFQ